MQIQCVYYEVKIKDSVGGCVGPRPYAHAVVAM
jgi:hypothetical protein